MRKRNLFLLLTLMIFSSCITPPEPVKPSAVYYPDVERPKLGLSFSQDESGSWTMSLPSGEAVEISAEFARHFRDYGAEIKAFESEANAIIDYYRSFFYTKKDPAGEENPDREIGDE